MKKQKILLMVAVIALTIQQATVGISQSNFAQDQFSACSAYLSDASTLQLIGSGITIAAGLFFSFTKKNFPQIIKDVGNFLMTQAGKNKVEK